MSDTDKIKTLMDRLDIVRQIKADIASAITSKGVATKYDEPFGAFPGKIGLISGSGSSGSGGSSGGGSEIDISKRLYIVKDTQFLNPEEYVTYHISANSYMSVKSGNGIDEYCVIGNSSDWSQNALFHNPTKHSLYNANKYKKLHIEFMFHGDELYHSLGTHWDSFYMRIASQEKIADMYNNMDSKKNVDDCNIFMGYNYVDPKDGNSYRNVGFLKDIKKNTYYKKDIDISSFTDGMECFDIVFNEGTKGCISIRNMYLY